MTSNAACILGLFATAFLFLNVYESQKYALKWLSIVIIASALLIFSLTYLLGYKLSKYGYLYVTLIFGMLATSPILLASPEYVQEEGHKVAKNETDKPDRCLSNMELAMITVSILLLISSNIVCYTSN